MFLLLQLLILCAFLLLLELVKLDKLGLQVLRKGFFSFQVGQKGGVSGGAGECDALYFGININP